MERYTVETITAVENGVEKIETKKRPVFAHRGADGQMHIKFSDVLVKSPSITNLNRLSLRIGKDEYKAVSGRIEQIMSGTELIRAGIALITIEITRDKRDEYEKMQDTHPFTYVECTPRYAECGENKIDLNGQYYFGDFRPLSNGKFTVNIIQR